MKHLLKLLPFLLFFFIILTNSIRVDKSSCSISTISIPIGSSGPVMVYNAKNIENSWKLTVLSKEQVEKLNVKGKLFYTDQKTGEVWYSDSKSEDVATEAMRDAFSLCRKINEENKLTNAYEKDKMYENLRRGTFPENVSLRMSVPNQMVSFLQTAVDDDMALLESLDYAEVHPKDPNVEEYKQLNNEAYITKRLVEDDLKGRRADDNYFFD